MTYEAAIAVLSTGVMMTFFRIGSLKSHDGGEERWHEISIRLLFFLSGLWLLYFNLWLAHRLATDNSASAALISGLEALFPFIIPINILVTGIVILNFILYVYFALWGKNFKKDIENPFEVER